MNFRRQATARPLFFAVTVVALVFFQGVPGERLKEVGPLQDLARRIFNLRFLLPGFDRNKQPLLSPEELDQVRQGSFAGESTVYAASPEARAFRVLSWNIERGARYQGILELLKGRLASEIYLLQEVDLYCRRTGFRDTAELLARELGLHYAYGMEFQEPSQGGSGKAALQGQAVLSRFPITRARVLRFQNQREDWSKDFLSPRRGGRIALVAELQTPWGKLVTYDVHLENRSSGKGRALQTGEILQDIQAHYSHYPVIVAGDLNTRDRQHPLAVKRLAQEGFADVFSVDQQNAGATHKVGRLDWIMIQRLSPLAAQTHRKTPYSDHRPISAVIHRPDLAAVRVHTAATASRE